MRTIKGYLDQWRIQEYLLITFFISWLSWGILIVLTALNVITFVSPLGILFFGIGGFGPTISALMCIEGKLTFSKVRNFIFAHKKQTIGYFLLFAILEIAVIGLSSMQINPDLPWYALPVVFIVCTLLGGGNEELGWRGSLQPLLERVFEKKIKNARLRFAIVVVCVGAIWGLWHLPLWFVNGSTQQGIPFGWFFLDAIMLSYWIGCVYSKTRSVFYCMLLHGLSNVLMSFFIIEINWVLVIGYLVMTTLAIVLIGNPKSSVAKSDQLHDRDA